MGKSRGKLGKPHENPLGTHWEHTKKQKQKQKLHVICMPGCKY
jgi:hypothetical protein